MNNNPKYSIIVPCYNSQKTIKKALNSILKQKYENYEVLIVDDGSKDDSTKEIDDFLKNKRFKLLTKENGGQTTAITLGIKNAKGEYIIQLDADDEFVEDAFNIIDKEIEDYDMLSFGFNVVDTKTNKVIKENKKALQVILSIDIKLIVLKSDIVINPNLFKSSNKFNLLFINTVLSIHTPPNLDIRLSLKISEKV